MQALRFNHTKGEEKRASTKAHKILVGSKGWIGKHFRERKWKHGWKKPRIVVIE